MKDTPTAENKQPTATPHQDPVFEKKMEDIHRRKYLSNIRLLPDLRQKKSQEYLEVILTLIALIIAGVFAIRPTITTILNLEQQVNDATQLDDQLRAKASAIASLDAQYTELGSKLPTILEAVPQNESAEMLVAELQGLASGHNLKLSTLTVSPLAQPNTTIQGVTPPATLQATLAGISFSFTAQGSYDDLRGFINDVINIQRMVTLESITMSLSTKGDVLGITLSGTAYFLP